MNRLPEETADGRPDGYHFHPLSVDGTLPEAFRPLDRAVARWVVVHGGSARLALLAGWASLADGYGDSALPLAGGDAGRHGMPRPDAALPALLAAEPLVATGGEIAGARPFVLERGHFYLRRNWGDEVAAAALLDARIAARREEPPVPEADLDVLFRGSDPRDVRAQRAAVAGAPGCRLFVLTGGPGTGKTSTVLRMLLLLERRAAAAGMPPPAIRLAAPTGKAAQRLSEALREGAVRLRAGATALPEAWQPWLAHVLAADAGTVHRMLGSRGAHGGFRHGRDDPLPADIVVVDEASMLDLALLRALLEALPADALLVLVGDADQLTSVGTGSVLLDLVGALEARGAPDLVRLDHGFRTGPELARLHGAILAGDPAAFAQAFGAAPARAVRHRVETAEDVRERLAAWSEALRQLMAASGAFERLPEAPERRVLAVLEALRARQLLCALREGPFGAIAANAAIERVLCADEPGAAVPGWYPGRALMVTRNDSAAGLWNGDVGVCLADAQGRERVWFMAGTPDAGAGAAPSAAQRGVRAFAVTDLPAHEAAFAATIHKSQGSEYAHVALLLPPDPGNRILSRQLLYTGASRARQVVELWAGDDALAAALASPIRRAGCLRERLTGPLPEGARAR